LTARGGLGRVSPVTHWQLALREKRELVGAERMPRPRSAATPLALAPPLAPREMGLLRAVSTGVAARPAAAQAAALAGVLTALSQGAVRLSAGSAAMAALDREHQEAGADSRRQAVGASSAVSCREAGAAAPRPSVSAVALSRSRVRLAVGEEVEAMMARRGAGARLRKGTLRSSGAALEGRSVTEKSAAHMAEGGAEGSLREKGRRGWELQRRKGAPAVAGGALPRG
jgi:hypothetical protein